MKIQLASMCALVRGLLIDTATSIADGSVVLSVFHQVLGILLQS